MSFSYSTIQVISTENKLWSIDIHPSNKIFVFSGSDNKIHLYSFDDINLKSNKILVLEGYHTRTIRYIKFNHKGNLLAASSFDGTTSVFIFPNSKDNDFLNYHLLTVLKGHENEVKGIDWSIYDNYLATSSRDKSIWIWQYDIETDEFDCESILDGHTQDVKYVKFHTSINTILFSCSYDNSIKIWNKSQLEEDWICVNTLNYHINTVWGLCIKDDEMYSCGEDKRIIGYKTDFSDSKFEITKKFLLEDSHERPIYSIDSIDKILVSSGGDNKIKIFSIGEECSLTEKVCIFNSHDEDVNCVKFIDLNEEYLVILSCGDDGRLVLNKMHK